MPVLKVAIKLCHCPYYWATWNGWTERKSEAMLFKNVWEADAFRTRLIGKRGFWYNLYAYFARPMDNDFHNLVSVIEWIEEVSLK
jgi:hypothetical protein